MRCRNFSKSNSSLIGSAVSFAPIYSGPFSAQLPGIFDTGKAVPTGAIAGVGVAGLSIETKNSKIC
jgi:hypothetical protein